MKTNELIYLIVGVCIGLLIGVGYIGMIANADIEHVKNAYGYMFDQYQTCEMEKAMCLSGVDNFMK